MRVTKISLLASLLLYTSSFAVDNIEVSGAGKFFYGTVDGSPDGTSRPNLFNKEGAFAQFGIDMGIAADLGAGFKGKIAGTGLATANMGGNIVNAPWATGMMGSQVWLSEVYLNKNVLDKTAVTLGRQSLDTPFAFTELWNIAANTFDAVLVENTDLSDTTLIGAYIDKGNGVNGFATVNPAIADSGKLKNPFKKFYEGAYVVGAKNKSFNGTELQAWFYELKNTAKSYWIQGDTEFSGITLGAQAAVLNLDNTLDSSDNSKAYAAKIGYTAIENLTLSAAVSQTDKDGSANFQIANLATGGSGGAQSKLYTEAWWNFGYVGKAGTTAYNVTALYTVPEIVDLGFFYTDVDQRAANGDNDMREYTLTAAKSFGSLDTSLAYVYSKANDYNDAKYYNNIQVYLTYKF
ncbi:hypothetical protein Sulku_0132 [Sulfuricurvum kujiense DSM 16994]|uniref:Outer membrane porin n=1 Tax=Sulfuricurvum kujiense (strain ATCC BAA-921 / DSM 16994 / JCM 11577 / YK-1) TaxID=709032 RepID=E4TWW8_SULKY|nr:hypothetical protein [Sulfuricurvum kujiense]ADR32799.1 hypothetical protein Sulku_0132 [Sulfuricurvum kujiense DSM 16994]